MEIKYLYIFGIISLMMWQCTEVKDWHDPKDNVPPEPVSQVQVENINGGAVITFTRPAEEDLMGVKAVYSFGEDDAGKEVYASAFTNTIVLEGYADTNEHTVHLYAVDKSGNVSVGVPVTIKPLTPPIELIRKSLHASETFGGVYVTWDNTLQKDLAVSLYVADSTGYMLLSETYFSNTEIGRYAFRGFGDPVERNFRIELKDRWNHYSAPLDTILTPLKETEILGRDKGIDIWTQYGWVDNTWTYRGDLRHLPTATNNTFNRIVDGNLFTGLPYFQCVQNLSYYVPDATDNRFFPMYLTIDMGRKASYSRMKTWMRERATGNPGMFSGIIYSTFEIWGTNNPKPVQEIGNGSREDNLKYWTGWPQVGGTDEWKNDWVKIADCQLVLPSGATKYTANMVLSADDQAYIRNGYEFDMDIETANQAFRYLRFYITDTNTGVGELMLAELKFWGSYAD
ncbi:MAG: DUF4959 domain-containing protein [Mangrovibacterium sp.]